MFLNSKSLMLLRVLVFFSVTILIGQQSSNTPNSTLVGYKELVLDGTVSYLPIYKIYDEKAIGEGNNENLEHTNYSKVYEEDWNNIVFNVHRKKRFPDPFLLHFIDTVFVSPVEHKMVVTSRYGWRRGRPHQGIDIDLKTGDNVRTILGGKVRYARYHSGHGRTVVVRHDSGLETIYAHLSEYAVKENDIVEKGQIIGKGGVSGNARGSHLHLEVRYKGKSIHPEYLFEFNEQTKVRSSSIVVTKKWMSPRLHKSTKKSNIVVVTDLSKHIPNDLPTRSIYVVKKGDTLHGIARKYHIDVSEICKINSIQYNSVLNIGQEILIY